MKLKLFYVLFTVFSVTLFGAWSHNLLVASTLGLLLSFFVILPVHAITSINPNDTKKIPAKNTPIDGSTYVNQISDNQSEVIENTRDELKEISGVMDTRYDYGDDVIYVYVDQNLNAAGWVTEDIEKQFPDLRINNSLRLEIVDY